MLLAVVEVPSSCMLSVDTDALGSCMIWGWAGSSGHKSWPIIVVLGLVLQDSLEP